MKTRHFVGGAVRLALALTCLYGPAVHRARAQPLNSGVALLPSQRLNTPGYAPATAPTQHLFGDWLGMRSWLAARGIALSSTITTEVAGNITGGKTRGADYAGQVALQADIDLAKIAGLTGLMLHGVVVQRSGRRQATDYLGDTTLNSNEIYGSGGNVGARLAYLYAEQQIPHNLGSIAAGRLAPATDFTASPLNCNFMISVICGNTVAVKSTTALENFPRAPWGGRVRLRPVKHFYLMSGIYGVSVLPGGRSGWSWSNDKNIGESFPVEAGWEPVFGHHLLTGHYKIGFIYDDSSYADKFTDYLGRPIAVTGRAARMRHGRTSAYILIDQMLFRHGAYAYDGLNVMAGWSHSDPATSTLSDHVYAGLVDTGVIPGRPLDITGLIFNYVNYSGQLSNYDLLYDAVHPHGAQRAVPTHTMIIEADYNIAVHRGVSVMPDFQYWIQPGGSRKIPDAAVLGFKLKVNL